MLEYPKKEPSKYDERLLKLGHEMETKTHIAWRVEKEHYDNFNSISKEERQQIIDLFTKGGITIREVGEKLGVPSTVVGDVIYLNIASARYLRSETL